MEKKRKTLLRPTRIFGIFRQASGRKRDVRPSTAKTTIGRYGRVEEGRTQKRVRLFNATANFEF